MHPGEAVGRLNELLPLKDRQRRLDEPARDVHRAMLRSLAVRGCPLTRSEVAALPGVGDPGALLERLGRDDLVVLDPGSREPLGAYPMTAEPTPHFLTVNGRQVNAMCAVDALAVGAMFDAEVTIASRCHVTGAPIRIRQSGHRILAAEPSADVRVGVRWQTPEGPAAHSLCLEMVFLRDGEVAAQWQGSDAQNISLFTLDEAVDFGARFFLPLFED